MLSMARRLTAIAGLTLLTTAPLAAAEPVEIRFKWPQGQVVHYRMTQETTGSSQPAGGPPMQSSQKHASTRKMEVKEVAADGAATVHMTVETLRIELQQPRGPKFIYDSTDPQTSAAGNLQVQALAAAVGQPITAVITPAGQVREVEGMDRILDQMREELNVAAAALEGLKKQAGDQAAAGMMERWLGWLPERPVAPGDEWKQHFQQPLPGLGTIKMDCTMTLREVVQVNDRPMARISSVLSIDLEPGDDLQALPGAQISMADGAGEGEMLFDLEAGQIHQMRLTTQMPIQVKVKFGGEESVTKQERSTTLLVERVAE